MDQSIHDVPIPHTAFKTKRWVWAQCVHTDKLCLVACYHHLSGFWNALRRAAGFAHMRRIGCSFHVMGPAVKYRCRSPPFLRF